MTLCSVCEGGPPNGGLLDCKHGFCTDCYSRYINGSLDELRNFLRCCVCGKLTKLTYETRQERVIKKFGRDQEMKLMDPRGLCVTKDGKYIITDDCQNRVIIYGKDGELCSHFATVFKNKISWGLAVINEDVLVIPFKDDKYVSLGFYALDGTFRGYTYLKPDCEVGGIALGCHGNLYITDRATSCIYVVNQSKILTNCIRIDQLADDFFQPCPHAITINKKGHILISDVANHRIRTYDEHGNFMYALGGKGLQPGQFMYPVGIAVDEKDRILVAERDNHRVQVFTERGLFLRFLVRYNKGDDVYMAPVDVKVVNSNEAAILLGGIKASSAGEVKIYQIIDSGKT